MSTSGAPTELAISGGGDTRPPYQDSDAGGEPGQATLADCLGTRLGPAATFATTEHFNLQTARAVTVSEANGRASIYLAALSGNLIALAFVGQMSRLGAAFYAFALILLPVLAFVGVVTFVRLVQSSIEDIACAHRIALLRSFYLRVSPELEPYFAVARPAASAHGNSRSRPPAWSQWSTASWLPRAPAWCWKPRASIGWRFRSPSEEPSGLVPSRCRNATTAARATRIARGLSIGPRS
jgi:hypothetical protein